MKIKDCGNFKEMDKMISDYIRKQYQNNFNSTYYVDWTVENRNTERPENTYTTDNSSDFYYIESAKNLKNELIDKTGINNISIIKINDKKYRLLAGPFKNFNALKTSYISLNNLGFENLNINKID